MANNKNTTEATDEEIETDEKAPISEAAKDDSQDGDEPDQEVEEELDPMEKLELMCKQLEEKAAESHERLVRGTAELENQKKRTAREMSDFRKYANESIIKQLLTVVDNLERAIDSVSDDSDAVKSIVDGVNLTHKEIIKVLEKFNTKPVDSFEQPFDPNLHQAVMQEETGEYEEGIVIKELQKGYLLHERLIRPAMVVVSKAVIKEEKK